MNADTAYTVELIRKGLTLLQMIRTQKEWSAEISTSNINGSDTDLEMQYDTEVWCVACRQLNNFKK